MRSSNSTLPQLVVLGVPASKRVADFVEAAGRLGFARPRVVSYVDYLTRRVDLATVIESGCVIRIESPGGCWETERLILREGIVPLKNAGAVPISWPELQSKENARGEIHSPSQWYAGYKNILEQIEAECTSLGLVKWMSHPANIIDAFDKYHSQSCWLEMGLPVPRFRTDIDSYKKLRDSFPECHRRLFIKLRYGYSAIGAIALEWRGSKVRAITTAETCRDGQRLRLFVTKKIRVLQNEQEIAALVDLIAAHGIIVEDWLPKAKLDGRGFDLRVITINGQAMHVVGRSTQSPFSNLNLDAVRIPATRVSEVLGEVNYNNAMRLCCRATNAYPKSLYLGIDLLVKPNKRDCVLLEANAFGDYIPRVTHDGKTIYTAELVAVAGGAERPCLNYETYSALPTSS